MFKYTVKNYIGMVVNMKDGFYTREECELQAKKALVETTGVTQATVYEDDRHVKTLHWSEYD